MNLDVAFEWDSQKATDNFAKHGVSFERATFAFSDPFAVEIADQRQDYGEDRILLLGQVGRDLLAVIYTERGEKIRLISVRRATSHERRYYKRQNAN